MNIDPMEHTGLVQMVLNRYSWLYTTPSAWTRDDAYQEGMIGLIEALQTYDSDLGTVATYCLPRIKWSLLRAYKEQQDLIRKPSGLHEILSQYKKIQLDYIQECQREPDIQYMAAMMKMTIPDLKQFLDLFNNEISFDAPLKDDPDLTVGDTLSDGRDPFDELDHKLQMEQLRKDFQSMMDERLTAQDQTLLKDYYGWYGGELPTITALAERYGMTPDVVNRKIKKAITSLQRYRRQLVKHYPDLLMWQIYTQSTQHLGDLKNLKMDTLRKYLTIGDLVKINTHYGTVSDINYGGKSFQFTCSGISRTIPFKNVTDFEMSERKITNMFIYGI